MQLAQVAERGGNIVLVEPHRGRGKGNRVIVGVHATKGRARWSRLVVDVLDEADLARETGG